MNFSNTQNEILEIEITKKGFLKEKKRKEKIYREKKLNYEEEFSQASQCHHLYRIRMTTMMMKGLEVKALGFLWVFFFFLF